MLRKHAKVLRKDKIRSGDDDDSASPLWHASRAGHLECVEFIASQVSSEEVMSTSKLGYTCLHVACERGHANLASFLIEMYPFLTSVTSDDRRTVLHTACSSGHAR